MQNPTEEAETFVPTETVLSNGRNLNPTVAVRRKAAKRSEPWYLAPPPPQNLAAPLPPSPQAEDIPARKKQRLEDEPLTRATDEATRKTTSPDISVGLPPPAADNDDANAEPVKDTHDVLDCRFDRAIGRNGYWTEDEDLKLKNSVQMHRGKNWNTIAAMVPGRTKSQCNNRWRYGLDPSIALPAGSTGTGTWAEDEDLKLTTAAQIHGGKDWAAIAVMVPGRTKIQCNKRWHNALDPSIALTAGSTGAWTEDEDLKLKAAVQTHGGKNWNKIAALVPGRTKRQCRDRWHSALDPSVAPTAGRTGTWTVDEDLKLKAAVQIHGGKNWNAIAAMVPGRTKNQCNKRWHNYFDPSVAPTAGRTGTWTEDEDNKLKVAVQMQGGKNWNAIAALVPGRTKHQCHSRWRYALDPSMALTAEITGTWAEAEVLKLKAAVQMHGGKNWNKIAALVPGRTVNQSCQSRWHHALDPSIALTAGSTGT
jgi:uncharacterized protein (DUF2237 family)